MRVVRVEGGHPCLPKFRARVHEPPARTGRRDRGRSRPACRARRRSPSRGGAPKAISSSFSSAPITWSGPLPKAFGSVSARSSTPRQTIGPLPSTTPTMTGWAGESGTTGSTRISSAGPRTSPRRGEKTTRLSVSTEEARSVPKAPIHQDSWLLGSMSQRAEINSVVPSRSSQKSDPSDSTRLIVGAGASCVCWLISNPFGGSYPWTLSGPRTRVPHPNPIPVTTTSGFAQG